MAPRVNVHHLNQCICWPLRNSSPQTSRIWKFHGKFLFCTIVHCTIFITVEHSWCWSGICLAIPLRHCLSGCHKLARLRIEQLPALTEHASTFEWIAALGHCCRTSTNSKVPLAIAARLRLHLITSGPLASSGRLSSLIRTNRGNLNSADIVSAQINNCKVLNTQMKVPRACRHHTHLITSHRHMAHWAINQEIVMGRLPPEGYATSGVDQPKCSLVNGRECEVGAAQFPHLGWLEPHTRSLVGVVVVLALVYPVLVKPFLCLQTTNVLLTLLITKGSMWHSKSYVAQGRASH